MREKIGKKVPPRRSSDYNKVQAAMIRLCGEIPPLPEGLRRRFSWGPEESAMSKKAVWLIILFTALFLLGVNTGDLEYLMNLGNTICLACIGVG